MSLNKKNGFLAFTILLILTGFRVNAQDLTHFRTNKSSVHGNLSVTGIGYAAQGISPRKDPFSLILSGNVNVNLKGFVLLFSFVYSNRNKDFRQPFNQFGLSPKYKWIKVHLGYRNVSWSKYVLGGHTVFGAGLELNPGIFRFGIMYGRLQRTSNTAVKINNPLTDTISAFNRKMISMKIGVGNRETFFDILFLKAVDDSSSLDPSAKETGTFPAANIVGGINTKVKISRSLHFEGEGAYSVYTDNINSVPFPVEFKHFTFPIPVNISTQHYLAARASLIYKSQRGLMFGLNYRRIDPGYKSMGIYFVNSDAENITVSAGFNALKRTLRFKGSLGLERNNLWVSRNATTKKVIGSANLSYNPVRVFGLSVNYSNYSINQTPGRVQIADSIKLYQTNTTLVVMPHFQFRGTGGKANHFINLLYTKMGLNDKNPNTEAITSFTTSNIMLSYNLSFPANRLSFITSLTYNKVNMAAGTSVNKSASVGISKSFLKNRLNLSLNATFTQSQNSTERFNVITPVFNARYRVGKHHNFRLKFYAVSNHNKTDNSKTFSEQTGDFSYVFTF